MHLVDIESSSIDIFEGNLNMMARPTTVNNTARDFRILIGLFEEYLGHNS